MKPLANLNPQREPKGAMAVRSSASLCENSPGNHGVKNPTLVFWL
jgi:hypothetical protein